MLKILKTNHNHKPREASWDWTNATPVQSSHLLDGPFELIAQQSGTGETGLWWLSQVVVRAVRHRGQWLTVSSLSLDQVSPVATYTQCSARESSNHHVPHQPQPRPRLGHLNLAGSGCVRLTAICVESNLERKCQEVQNWVFLSHLLGNMNASFALGLKIYGVGCQKMFSWSRAK